MNKHKKGKMGSNERWKENEQFTVHRIPITKAFTLAEVLITLAIIGIVAAMTMPALISKYQKHAAMTALKKTYSTFYQAVNMYKAVTGSDTWDLNDETTPEGVRKKFDEYLKPYLKSYKVCEQAKKCFAEHIYGLNGRELWAEEETHANIALIMSDGTLVKLYISHNNFNAKIDINGLKGPNVMGKDIYELGINPKHIEAACYKENCTREEAIESPNYGCNKNATGGYCTYVIIQDGWQFKEDYPW